MKVRRPHASKFHFAVFHNNEDSYVRCTLLMHKLAPDYSVISPTAGGTMNTTSHNVTNHNVTNNNKTNHNTSLNATNPDSSDCATNDTTTINVTTSTRGCREKCSIQFCSQRARICSARG